MHRPLLVAFDFDHTISNENTDVVAQNLLPKERVSDEVKKLYRSNDWTAYMGKIFELLNENSIRLKDIENAIINIPAVPGIEKLLLELHRRGHNVIIISDSNSIFIDWWLKHKSLNHCITQIFTNPAKVDENGTIILERYHTQEWCSLSSVNLCKGFILKQFIENQNNQGVSFDKVIYVGDGQNDLCPVLHLSEKDIAFPRIGYSLARILGSRKTPEVAKLKSKVVFWTTGEDILSELIGEDARS